MVYLIVWISLSLLAAIDIFKASEVGSSRKKNIIVFIAFSFVLIFGLRRDTGTDYSSYENVYNGLSVGFKEPLFNLLIEISRPFGFHFFIFLICLLTVFFWFSSCASLSTLPYLSILILFSNFFFYYGLSGIRQGLALSIVAYGVSLESKFFRTLCFILASLVHISALVAFSLPLASRLGVIALACFNVVRKLRIPSFRILSLSSLFYLVFACFVCLFAINYSSGKMFVNIIYYNSIYINGLVEFSLLNGIIVRLFPVFLFIFALIFGSSDADPLCRSAAYYWFYVYIFGLITYILLSSYSPEVAIRSSAYFTQFDFLLIPFSISLVNSFLNKAFIYFFALVFAFIALSRYLNSSDYDYTFLWS